MKLCEAILLEKMTRKEAIELLDLKAGDDVKKAYRSASKIHHPDAGGSDTMMKKVNMAYDLLKDIPSGKISVEDAESWEERKERMKKENNKRVVELTRIQDDLVKMFKGKYDKFKEHLEEYFVIDDIVIDQRKFKKDAPMYSSDNSGKVVIKWETKDGKTHLALIVDFSLDRMGGGALGTGELQYKVSYDTVVYYNRKDHTMKRGFYHVGMSDEVFDPEFIFPKAKLKKIIKKKATSAMTRKDFQSALQNEGKKLGGKWFNDSMLFSSKKWVVKDFQPQRGKKGDYNLVMEINRHVFMRVPVWNVNFRCDLSNGDFGHISRALTVGRDLPKGVSEKSFLSCAENAVGLDALIGVVKSFQKGKIIKEEVFSASHAEYEKIKAEKKLKKK